MLALVVVLVVLILMLVLVLVEVEVAVAAPAEAPLTLSTPTPPKNPDPTYKSGGEEDNVRFEPDQCMTDAVHRTAELKEPLRGEARLEDAVLPFAPPLYRPAWALQRNVEHVALHVLVFAT